MPGAASTYLTNGEFARSALNWRLQLGLSEALSAGSVLPNWFNYHNRTWLMFEGVSPGEMRIRIALVDHDSGDIEYELDSVKIEIKDINHFYASVSTENAQVPNYPEFTADGIGATEERYESVDPLPGRQIAEMGSSSDVILFIHGFNVNLDDYKPWFTELYKRLYWSGYRGEFIGLHWHGKDGIVFFDETGAGANFNQNVEHAFESGSTLAKWIPTIAQGRRVTILTHSAGAIVALEALRLMALSDPMGAKVANLITMQGATFQNYFSPTLGEFDNISATGWASPSLGMISGRYENFYSSQDGTLSFILRGNETAGFSKIAGHPRDSLEREILEAIPRTANRLAYIIPGIHSPGSNGIFGICDVPHATPPLGSEAVPGRAGTDCTRNGFGIDGHSSLRERNHYETYKVIQRILEIAR